ncbi:MAG: NADH-ubiquinone oxidoreductase-F iron-sulfur binding region domain-containing protein [Chitinophagales bacterium]
MPENLSYLLGRKGLDKNLFEELGIAAQDTGTPDLEKMEELRKEFLVGKSTLYGTTSFYDFLRPENKGKKVYICNGSACLTADTQGKLKDKILKEYSSDEVGDMCCLGRCHENGAFHIDGKNYSGTDIENLTDIKKTKSNTKETYNVAYIGTPILTEKIQDLNQFYSLLKTSLSKSPDELLNEIKASGIRGRGGAGFAMGFKLESCKNTPSQDKFVVCNADEGDPGAYSDRYLLEEQPHKLLLGMILTGYVIGANWGVVYIRGEYPASVDKINDSIAFLRENHLIGKNILDSNFNFDFKVVKAMGAYICGEETALLSSIEGQRPEVRVRPPYPTQVGLFNKPTVVNNVETLANIPFILANGGAKYASIGTVKSTGTKLVCLDSHFNQPGMYEVDMGTPLQTVIEELGKGFNKRVKALHIGGPLGGLVPVSKIKNLSIDFDSFGKEGFLLGHASVVSIPENFPLVKYIEHLFQFTAHESCGKCFPCRLGSTRGYELFKKAQNEDYKIDRTLLNDLLNTMEKGSLCALGGGLPLPIKNALMYFEEELKEYLK